MAVKSLSDIKEEEGHDIESAVNENTLIAGETSAGVFGVFKLFEGVKKALNNITTISGNKTFSNNVVVNGSLKCNDITEGGQYLVHRKIVVLAPGDSVSFTVNLTTGYAFFVIGQIMATGNVFTVYPYYGGGFAAQQLAANSMGVSYSGNTITITHNSVATGSGKYFRGTIFF